MVDRWGGDSKSSSDEEELLPSFKVETNAVSSLLDDDKGKLQLQFLLFSWLTPTQIELPSSSLKAREKGAFRMLTCKENGWVGK